VTVYIGFDMHPLIVHQNGFDFLMDGFRQMNWINALFLIYVIGTILSVLSPISGFIQSICSFILLIVMLFPSEPIWIWVQWFPIGELIGVFSGIIVVLSFFKPQGIGYRHGEPIPLRTRLFSFSRLQKIIVDATVIAER
jgi:hypothetical protein